MRWKSASKRHSSGTGEMAGLEVFGAATVLCLLALVAITGFLCRRALRDGGDFEAEVRALTFGFRVRATK